MDCQVLLSSALLQPQAVAKLKDLADRWSCCWMVRPWFLFFGHVRLWRFGTDLKLCLANLSDVSTFMKLLLFAAFACVAFASRRVAAERTRPEEYASVNNSGT